MWLRACARVTVLTDIHSIALWGCNAKFDERSINKNTRVGDPGAVLAVDGSGFGSHLPLVRLAGGGDDPFIFPDVHPHFGKLLPLRILARPALGL